MKIVNLQSRDVVVYTTPEAKPIVFPSEGKLQVRMEVENLTPNGVVKRGYWTHTRGLPKQEPETLYIVSSLVAMYELYQNGRLDLVFPWALIYSHQGDVLACRALTRPNLPPQN